MHEVAGPRIRDDGRDPAQVEGGDVVEIIGRAVDQDRGVERFHLRRGVGQRKHRDLRLGRLVQRLQRGQERQVQVFVLQHHAGGHFRAVGQPVLHLLNLTIDLQRLRRSAPADADLRHRLAGLRFVNDVTASPLGSMIAAVHCVFCSCSKPSMPLASSFSTAASRITALP